MLLICSLYKKLYRCKNHFRPPDEFSQRPVETENVSDVEDVDGVMPSFYKFCAKTATGVFDKTINTIKTALPGNIQVEQSDNAWIFIQSDQTVSGFVGRFPRTKYKIFRRWTS